MGAPIGRGGLRDLAERHCADQHPIAFEQCEIGGDHELRLAQYLSDACAPSSPSNQASTALDSA